MIAMHNALQFALFLSLILYSFFYFYNLGALCCSTISPVVNPALIFIVEVYFKIVNTLKHVIDESSLGLNLLEY